MNISQLTKWFRRAPRKPIRNTDTVPLRTERLEEREVPAIYTVTWDGAGVQPAGTQSLQQAIAAANATVGVADVIQFAPSVLQARVATFAKVAGDTIPGLLPNITDRLTIDGLTGATVVVVNLESQSKADVVSGFHVTGTAANSIIRNLLIQDLGAPANFNGPGEFGVKVSVAAGGLNLQNVTIQGIDGDAVQIIGSKNNIIGGAGDNQAVVLTKNNGMGVWINGAASTNNLVQQATISSNAGDGVRIDAGASGNIVGGFTTSPVSSGNLIYANNGNGVHLNDSDNNRIQRNFIGNDGPNAKANAQHGIFIENGSANNIIGGNDLSAGNKISGNTENGIYIVGITSSGNQIQSNLIGLDPTATDTAMPNSGNGILIENAPNTKVGSTTTAANFISGNNLNGVVIMGKDSAGTVVVNNRIGIGGAALTILDKKVGNVQDGVLLDDVISVTVGGGGTNAQNIIGGNRHGIAVINGSSGVVLRGNQLGVNKLPDASYANIGNLQDGIFLENSSNITVGGTQSLEGNKIAGNRNGVQIVNTAGVTLQGNFIGTNLTGTIIPILVGLVENFQPAAQAEDGILIRNSSDIKVGTPAQGGGNLISRNRHGVRVLAGSSNVLIQNNRIGTQSILGNFSKTQHDLGNLDDGVHIDGTSNVTIGGTAPSTPNIIAKNLDGIQISGGSSNVVVLGNQIRNNSQSGVRIEASTFVTVGGSISAAKNTIMNRKLAGIDTTFTLDGVFITGGATNNSVVGNWIGTDSTNIKTNGLRGNGVLIDGASDNVIGGKTHDVAAKLEDGNIIAYNTFNGIAVDDSLGTAVGNSLLGNSIFLNGRLGIDLGNTAGEVTFNDFGDGDSGANNQQNFPVLTLAQSTAGTGTRIQGLLNSEPNKSYRIELFHIDVANPTGTPINYGQGQTFLGFLDVTTDSAGDAAFTFLNPALVLPAGQFITATATDLATGDTSEFGLAQVIEGAPGPLTYVVNNDGNIFPSEGADLLIPANGSMTLATAIRLANEHPGDDRIVFALHPQYTINGSTITYYQESRNLLTNGNLPDITDTLIIDGSYLAWPQVKGGDKRFTQNYGIVMNAADHGLRISDNPTAQAKFSNPNATADLVILRNFSISGPLGIGIEIVTKFGGANIQGVNISGFNSDGIRIVQSPNNIVGGSGAGQTVTINNISGTGVNIIGAASTKNLVQQTKIGNNFGAGGNGVWIQGADNNTVGGFTPGTEVSIRGSGANGVYVVGSSGTRIQRSIIGDPTNASPNAQDGVRIEDSPLTLIGGVNAGAGNNISGNTENGIRIVGSLSAGAQIQSNQVGTTVAPNSGNGIFVDNVGKVLIGSTVTAANNVDGNNLNGIYIRGTQAAGARIVNTSVGKGGGNILDGIRIEDVSDIIIGGSLSNAGGTVNANRNGINLLNASKVNIQQMIVSNSSEEGVRLENSTGIQIGGTTSALDGNTITKNRNGVFALNSSFVTLQGNKLTNHSEDGVLINGTGNVIIGSPFQFGGNLISGNRNGVRVFNGSTNFAIENNVIGTGTGGLGNTDDGIRLEGIAGAKIGGTQPLSQNFVSGNRNGLQLAKGSSAATILGNVFANSTDHGVIFTGSSNNILGGDTALERNVISSNGLIGVLLRPDFTNPLAPIFSNGNTIQGNFIGVDQAGQGNFGNGNAGIYIDGGSNNLVGGKVHDVAKKLEEGNIIGNSGASGVAVVTDNGPATGNSILGNGIFNSGGLGIDLNGNIGLVDDNDDFDMDGGANRTQNFPEITFAEVGLVSSVAQGKINSTPNTTFRIEFFGDAAANPNGTPAGFGQGRTFLGSMDVTTDAFGDATFDFFAPVAFTVGGVLSATATNLATGDTSEFSEAETVQTAVGKITGVKFDDTNGNGIFDPGEPGLAGWVIELEVADANGVFDGKVDAKTTTGAGGVFTFDKLTDGKYKLAEVLQTGWIQTASPVPNPVQITGGATITDVNFGNFKMVKVTGVKFEDVNGNQVRDPGEGPIAGVTINLHDSKTNAILATTKTDLSGNYAFTNLYVGKFGKADTGAYRVREIVPTGYTQTTPNPADFQIQSGKDIGPLNFGNKKTGGGGGGGTIDNNIIITGTGAGVTGEVKVFDAKGVLKFAFQPYGTTYRNGVRVAKGDVNGDGQVDIITAPASGVNSEVKVYDGFTATFLTSYTFSPTWKGGVHVGAADVNGDTFADVIIGQDAGTTSVPRVIVRDGKTGIELFNFIAYGSTFRGGVRVAGGDVNNDGFADIITAPGTGMAPTVRVWDGSTFGTGKAIMTQQFNAYETSFTRGVFVATGNVNSDGFAEIITGPDSGRQGDVRIWDGATGKMTLSFKTQGPSNAVGQITSDNVYNSGVRVAVVDMNGDGVDEVIVGPGIQKRPFVSLWDAKTGTSKLSFLAYANTFLGGVYVG